MKYIKIILAILILLFFSSIIEGTKCKRSHNKRGKYNKRDCPYSDGLSVTFKHGDDFISDDAACLSPSKGEITILGVEGVFNEIQDRVLSKLFNTFSSISFLNHKNIK